MNSKSHKRFWLFLLISLTLLSCKALDSFSLRLPSSSLPEMEKDGEAALNILQGGNWYALGQDAEETYTDDELAKPGTFIYTTKVRNDKPIYFNYGWCATTEEILKQNYEHIKVELFFNGKQLGDDVVHTFSYTTPDGMECGEFGVMILKIPAGTYRIETVVTFDDKINDGLSDYEAGEYFYEYHVTVEDKFSSRSGISATPRPPQKHHVI